MPDVLYVPAQAANITTFIFATLLIAWLLHRLITEIRTQKSNPPDRVPAADLHQRAGATEQHRPAA